MEVKLEEIKEMHLDLENYPKCTLQIRRKNNTLMHSIEFKTHAEGMSAMWQINSEWEKILKEKI